MVQGNTYLSEVYTYVQSGPRNATYTFSRPTDPIAIAPNTPIQFTLQAFRQKHLYLMMNGLVGYRASNASVAITVSSSNPSDAISLWAGASRWPGTTSSATATVQQVQGRVVVPLRCLIDEDNRLTYAVLAFLPSSFTIDEVAAGSRQATITVEVISDTIDPPSLDPNVGVFVPSGTRALYRLSAMGAALDLGANVNFIRNGSASVFLQSTGRMTTSGCSLASALNIASGFSSRLACDLAGYGRDVTVSIDGPVFFSYNVSAGITATENTQILLWTGSTTILGPRDPALYPLIVRVTPTVDFPLDIEVYSGFHSSSSCSSTSGSLTWCTFSWIDGGSRVCDVLLACPQQSVKMVMDHSGYTDNATYALVGSISARTSVSLLGSRSDPVTVAANSKATVSVTVPSGVSYRVTIVSTTSNLDSNTQFYYSFGCDAGAGGLTTSTTVNSTARQLTISSNGVLTLTASQFSIIFSVSYTLLVAPPVATPAVANPCVSPANVTIPPLCTGRITQNIFVSQFSQYTLSSSVSQANLTFGLFARAEVRKSLAPRSVRFNLHPPG